MKIIEKAARSQNLVEKLLVIRKIYENEVFVVLVDEEASESVFFTF